MSLKKLSRKSLLKMALAGVPLALILIFYLTPISGVQSSPAIIIKDTVPLLTRSVLPTHEPVSLGFPVRLKIPKIKVDADLEYTGLTPQGAVDVPKDFTKVSWFNLGPRPGEIGNAVITGHYGWKNGKTSVFDNLYKLRVGDKLSVTDENGKIISFVVRKIRRFDPKADASDVFISQDGKSHLNLITCEGIWNKILKSYSKRLVVFTDKE